jgi:hypothetical protein
MLNIKMRIASFTDQKICQFDGLMICHGHIEWTCALCCRTIDCPIRTGGDRHVPTSIAYRKHIVKREFTAMLDIKPCLSIPVFMENL